MQHSAVTSETSTVYPVHGQVNYQQPAEAYTSKVIQHPAYDPPPSYENARLSYA